MNCKKLLLKGISARAMAIITHARFGLTPFDVYRLGELLKWKLSLARSMGREYNGRTI